MCVCVRACVCVKKHGHGETEWLQQRVRGPRERLERAMADTAIENDERVTYIERERQRERERQGDRDAMYISKYITNQPRKTQRAKVHGRHTERLKYRHRQNA